MALRLIPFGASSGFSDEDIPGTHYYSQNFVASLFGAATLYSIVNKTDSNVVTGGTMGNIKYFAIGPAGVRFAQDDAGNILAEQTPGLYDFHIVHTTSGNGAGLLGDQYGRLFYATPTQLGMYDGTTWNDSYQSLSNLGAHFGDTYEDIVFFGNGNALAVLFSDNTFNSAAFSLPSGMTITASRSGPTGILIGANFGYQGAIILWDGISLRAKTPWKWVSGQILSIDRYGENWIVKTQREVLITNGYTIKSIFGTFDDPLSFKSYEDAIVLPQQMVVVNDIIIFANTGRANGPLGYEFGKMKPGIYLYQISKRAWNYIPVATGNTISLDIGSIFVDVNYNNRIMIGYHDKFLNVSYIAELSPAPPTSATFVSELIGLGRVKYQRGLLGPTDKIVEAVVLNLSHLNSITDPATSTFNVSLKIYDFKRQLWGKQLTNAMLSNKNQVRVDGTNAGFSKVQKGDEVTVLCGANAGLIAHITAIASQGTTTETWTLDTAFPNNTENQVFLQVQPFIFVGRKSFTDLSKLKTIFFDVNKSIRGKEFLAKVVLDGIGENLQLEMQLSYFAFDDIGYDQT